MALLSCLGVACAVAQVLPDRRYEIRTTVNGMVWNGSQELGSLLVGKSQAERDAISASSIVKLVRGSTFPLAVRVTGPDGVGRDYTGSSNVVYESLGCLTITATGLVTVKPSSSTCPSQTFTVLSIYVKNAADAFVDVNEYLINYED